MKNIPAPDSTSLFGTPLPQLKQKATEQQTGILALAAQWLVPASKEHLKQRLRSDAKGSFVETSDEALSKEYFRSWLEIPMSNPLQRLIRHPLLSKEDKNFIDTYVIEEQQKQIKTGATLTAVTSAFYWVFLSKMSFFQNTFNNKERRRIFNIGRKTLALYLVFFGWMMVLNSHYEKKIPNGLNEKGIFKKYRISFQQKFV